MSDYNSNHNNNGGDGGNIYYKNNFDKMPPAMFLQPTLGL